MLENKNCLNCGNQFIGRLSKKYCSRQCYFKKPDLKAKIKETALKWNAKKRFQMSIEQYNSLTQSCSVCSWKWDINLHHIDFNKRNNNLNNLVALCHNHHFLIHKLNIKLENLKEFKSITNT